VTNGDAHAVGGEVHRGGFTVGLNRIGTGSGHR
jgi:hypothetical protein